MTMSESALEAELLRAQDEARQARAELQESARRVSELEASATAVQIRTLEEQIEELRAKVKDSAFPGSPKTQSDDEYIVVEQESPESLSFQLKEREAEIKKAIAHAKKLEEMYNAAEERTLMFERQVQVLEANMFEKFDDGNALLEKVKELDALLTVGQFQINALEEKSKTSDEAQKKVEYEKVLFLETEDQLVKNFRKAHDEAEQYRIMIDQLEASIKNAEEKAAHAERCMEVASQRNQELESEIADLSLQLQCNRPERELMEPKVELLDQEPQMYRDRDQKKVDDDVRSVDEKTVVHEATSTSSTHPTSTTFEDEMKFLGENAMAHITQSKLLMSQIEKLQSDAFGAELRAQVLEGKVRELNEQIVLSGEREERLKQDAKMNEENASLFEGFKLSYADYTADLLKKNSKLDEELVIVREEVARLRDVEVLVADLRTQLNASEFSLGELSLNLQDKTTEYSSRVQALEAQLEAEKLQAASQATEHSSQVQVLKSHLSQLQEEKLSHATEHSSRVQALEAQLEADELQAASQAKEHSSLVQVLKSHVSQLEEEKLSHATEHSSQVQALEAQLEAEKLQAASQATEHSSLVQVLNSHVSQLQKEKLSHATEHSSQVEALEAELQEEKMQAASQAAEHSARVEALQAELQEEKMQAASQATEYSAQVEALQAVLQEEKMQAASRATEYSSHVKALQAELQEEKMQAASQAAEHSARVQALQVQISKLQGENSQAKASIAESRLWAQEAATLLREHVQSLRALGEAGGRAQVDDETGVLQAQVEELHLEFVDLQLCDGTEALEKCKKLSSLEKERLNSQIRDAAQKISKLEGELEALKAQIYALQNPPEPLEVKRSFREVILEGEVQSLRGKITEFKAQVSGIPSLQAQLAQLQLNLRAAEKREHEQNLALVKVQREASAAEEKVCSLKDSLRNQTQVNELKEQVSRLEQNLMKSEERNTSLKEQLDCHVKSNKETTIDVASDKVTDEIALEQTSGSQKQILQEPLKLKARKRKNKKNGKAPVSLNTSADGLTHSFTHRAIAVFLVSVLLVALVIRVSLR